MQLHDLSLNAVALGSVFCTTHRFGNLTGPARPPGRGDHLPLRLGPCRARLQSCGNAPSLHGCRRTGPRRPRRIRAISTSRVRGASAGSAARSCAGNSSWPCGRRVSPSPAPRCAVFGWCPRTGGGWCARQGRLASAARGFGLWFWPSEPPQIAITWMGHAIRPQAWSPARQPPIAQACGAAQVEAVARAHTTCRGGGRECGGRGGSFSNGAIVDEPWVRSFVVVEPHHWLKRHRGFDPHWRPVNARL